MKNFIKNISLFLIVFAFTLPLAMPVFLQIQNLHQQWLMLEKLETQQLTTITVNTSEIQWVKQGKECLLNGELFDVKNILASNDQVTLIGLFDEAEKRIKKSIEDNTKNEQQPNKAQQLIQLFSIIVTETETEKLILYFASIKKTAFINSIYNSHFPDYTTPPPKTC